MLYILTIVGSSLSCFRGTFTEVAELTVSLPSTSTTNSSTVSSDTSWNQQPNHNEALSTIEKTSSLSKILLTKTPSVDEATATPPTKTTLVQTGWLAIES